MKTKNVDKYFKCLGWKGVCLAQLESWRHLVHLGSTHFYNSQIRNGGRKRGRGKTHYIFQSHRPRQRFPHRDPSPKPASALLPPYPQPLSHKEKTGPTDLRGSLVVGGFIFQKWVTISYSNEGECSGSANVGLGRGEGGEGGCPSSLYT